MAEYNIEIRSHVDLLFKKMSKRDKLALVAIYKKVAQVSEDPYKFKPLHPPMQHLRRVHLNKSFVLTYSIDEIGKKVIIEDYAHHDDVYQ